MTPQMQRLVDVRSDEEKADLAAEILAEIDPTRTNIKRFFDKLRECDATFHGELCARAADEEE